jgi:hypothetical protein
MPSISKTTSLSKLFHVTYMHNFEHCCLNCKLYMALQFLQTPTVTGLTFIHAHVCTLARLTVGNWETWCVSHTTKLQRKYSFLALKCNVSRHEHSSRILVPPPTTPTGGGEQSTTCTK